MGKYKDLSRLTSGLHSVKESAKKTRHRLDALKKREDVLLSKIDEVTDQNPTDENEDAPSTISFAKAELAKVRYEERALTKKLKTCELNKKCILAEMAIISDVSPVDPLEQDIRFTRPISGRITSEFGLRMHPLDHVEKPHQGVDLAGYIGDPVKATASGKVSFAGVQRGYGKIVVIQHSEEYSSAYGHLSEIGVQVGDTVNGGEKIGEVGMTGNSTGPHLHFEIRKNDEPVDPIKYL